MAKTRRSMGLHGQGDQMNRPVTVYGPAYLDRVLRVEQPLLDPRSGPPLDQSVDGVIRIEDGSDLVVRDPSGFEIGIACPIDWPGPTGRIDLNRELRSGTIGRRLVRGVSWQDDLGGMGSGYAKALDGKLVSALGPESDPRSCAISRLLAGAGVRHRAIRLEHPADWTLLISSGGHGDKLPIGFRGCHASLKPEQLGPIGEVDGPGGILVVAAIPNRLAAYVLKQSLANIRFFAPAMRNMIDTEFPISDFCGAIDLLCCNRLEWEALNRAEEVAWRVSILVITDGPNGSTIRFTKPNGDPGRLNIPAFSRRRPPIDTNRAGESYAAELLSTLVRRNWVAQGGVVDPELIREAAIRASAAAGLVLDRMDFGFPSQAEIDDAIRLGRID